VVFVDSSAWITIHRNERELHLLSGLCASTCLPAANCPADDVSAPVSYVSGGLSATPLVSRRRFQLENRAIAETTARYPLPGKIVIADRNRGDFRFIKGQGFSDAVRNRLRRNAIQLRGWYLRHLFTTNILRYPLRVVESNRVAAGCRSGRAAPCGGSVPVKAAR